MSRKILFVICSFWVIPRRLIAGEWSTSYFIHPPMKIEPTVSTETSANRTQTTGNYPKRNKLHLEHGESLKTRKIFLFLGLSVQYMILLYIKIFYLLNTFVKRKVIGDKWADVTLNKVTIMIFLSLNKAGRRAATGYVELRLNTFWNSILGNGKWRASEASAECCKGNFCSV